MGVLRATLRQRPQIGGTLRLARLSEDTLLYMKASSSSKCSQEQRIVERLPTALWQM